MHSVRRVDNTATTMMPELARCTHPRIAQLANGDIMLLMLLIITGPRHEANINQALIKHQSRLSVYKTFSLIILGYILTTFSVARLRQGVRCVASLVHCWLDIEVDNFSQTIYENIFSPPPPPLLHEEMLVIC